MKESSPALFVAIRDEIKRKVRAMGLSIPAKPPDPVELPRDFTKIGGRDLGRLMQAITAHHSYAVYRLALADVTVTVIESQLDWMKAKRRAVSTERTVAKTDAQVSTSPEYRKLDHIYLRQYALKRLLESLVEGLDAKYKAVSREQTRRQQEFDKATGRIP